MQHLTNNQLNQLRNQLTEEKGKTRGHFAHNDHFGLSESLGENTGELSTYDNHPADIGTEVFERGKDLALNAHFEHYLTDIEHSLNQLETGEYGVCIRCGKPIPFARLEAVPTTQYCIEHVPQQHPAESRPIEEQILTEFPTPGTRFDGEDVWQIVEDWGTSSSSPTVDDDDIADYNNLYMD